MTVVQSIAENASRPRIPHLAAVRGELASDHFGAESITLVWFEIEIERGSLDRELIRLSLSEFSFKIVDSLGLIGTG